MICISLAIKDLQRLSAILKEVDLAEVRIDLCKLNKKEVARIFSSRANLIATCRPGLFHETERILLLKEAIRSGAGYVDLEVDSPASSRKEILKMARDRGCRVIMSYHDESGTPPGTRLRRIVRQCFSEGADLCKIACNCLSVRDMLRILSLYGEFENFRGRIIALGTGTKASLTRIVAPFFGAPFTYACLEESEKTAEGQLAFKRMQVLVSRLSRVLE